MLQDSPGGFRLAVAEVPATRPADAETARDQNQPLAAAVSGYMADLFADAEWNTAHSCDRGDEPGDDLLDGTTTTIAIAATIAVVADEEHHDDDHVVDADFDQATFVAKQTKVLYDDLRRNNLGFLIDHTTDYRGDPARINWTAVIRPQARGRASRPGHRSGRRSAARAPAGDDGPSEPAAALAADLLSGATRIAREGWTA